MEAEMTDVVSRMFPSYEQALRYVVIVLFGMIAFLALRGVSRLFRAAALPAMVLILSLLATLVGPPWGIEAGGDAASRMLAWSLFWAAVLLVRLADWGAEGVYLRRDKPFPVPVLLRRSLTAALYLVAAFLVLKFGLHIDITPLLATSAILTMVIGLALQGVLGNLLSGISLGLVRTVEVGNLIAVGDSEGVVVNTNWRETIIRTRDDDYIHIPNTQLASDKVTNFSKPKQTHRHHIDVGASYSDAPGDVIDALVEAARESGAVLDSPAPAAFLKGYLDFGINYRLYFWSKHYWRRSRVEGEVGRLIWYKFKRRGIEIPFPMSDELLNDFMAVVYNQRRLPPEEEEVKEMADLLASSGFLVRAGTGGGGEGEEAAGVAGGGSGAPLLGGEELASLARSCRLVRYTGGEILCRQGDPGETCYVVAKGSIDGSIEYREKGVTHRFTFEVKPGSLFGEMSLFTGMPRTATGKITEETTLLEIPRAAFARLLAEQEGVLSEIASMVAARNEENAEFLAKIESIPDEDRRGSRDSGHILDRLRNLASWGRKLLGRGS